MRTRAILAFIAVGSLLGPASLTKSAEAAPLAPAAIVVTKSADFGVTQVRWRHGGGGGALAAGLLTGAMIGGLLAAPGYYEPYPYYPYPYYPYPYGGYYGPRYVAPIVVPGREAYCFSRFRSYDPVSGTYLGRDGRRHYCR